MKRSEGRLFDRPLIIAGHICSAESERSEAKAARGGPGGGIAGKGRVLSSNDGEIRKIAPNGTRMRARVKSQDIKSSHRNSEANRVLFVSCLHIQIKTNDTLFKLSLKHNMIAEVNL